MHTQWKQTKIKYIFNINNGSTPKSGIQEYWDGDITWITPADIKPNNSKPITKSKRKITKSGYKNCGTTLTPPNSIILTCRAPIGNIAITNTETCTNQGCKTLTKKQRTIPLFYYYFLSVSTDTLNGLGNGSTFKELSTEDLANFLIPIPPLQTQRQIATFLDRKTEAIDTLIEKKQQLIERLEEKRTALINHVVTKGLDPDAPMKDPGIEWIGEVPRGWEIGKVGYYTSIGNGSTPSRENQQYWSNGSIPWLNSSQINQVEITHSEQYITPVALRECHLPTLEADTILMAITGEGQTRGRVAQLKINATINQHLAYIDNTSTKLNTKYLLRYLQGMYTWLRAESSGTGGTRAAITCSFIKTIPFPLPSQKEQLEIVQTIDTIEPKLTQLTTLLTSQIEKLQEYRQALITAAVTGQIDVSGEVVDKDVDGEVQEDQMSLL